VHQIRKSDPLNVGLFAAIHLKAKSSKKKLLTDTFVVETVFISKGIILHHYMKIIGITGKRKKKKIEQRNSTPARKWKIEK
jgi:polyphosphate kinase 2 (PPK2 family)